MRSKILFILLLCCLPGWGMSFSEESRRNCQWVDTAAQTVTLIFSPNFYSGILPVRLVKNVFVYGSITEYGDRCTGYQLDQVNEQGCYYHTFSYDELSRPGNSGQPEFCFIVDLQDDSTSYLVWPDTIGPNAIDKRRLFVNSETYVLITFPGGPDYFTEDLDELYARALEAKTVRPLVDYQLEDSVDQHRICNFRLTPGTVNLYRSYHPYYPDKPQYDTEVPRLYWVAELARRVGIRSDITLSSNYERYVGCGYECMGEYHEITMPDYHRALIDSGNIIYVGAKTGGHPSSGQCFYHSDGPYFAGWFKEVVEFIADERHPMPMQIHCALGADRTGMFCAVLAALCGADWQTIMADYSETGNMHIQTYRHPNRLRYAFRQLTGVDPDHCTTVELSAAVRRHFVDMGVLTDEQMDRMVARLKGYADTRLFSVELCPGEGQSYDVLGRVVGSNAGHVVIQQGQKRWIHE